MRFLWVDRDQEPDFRKGDGVAGERINGYFLDMRSATTTDLTNVRSRNRVAGIYAVTSWDDFKGEAPDTIVARVVARYQALNVPMLRLQWDIELHDPDFVREILMETRRRLPQVGLSWTLEPRQGGWIDPRLVNVIAATRTRVVPQLYPGDMRFQYDSLYVVRNLTSRGIPDAAISPMYDAAALPAGWDGYAFTQGRLP